MTQLLKKLFVENVLMKNRVFKKYTGRGKYKRYLCQMCGEHYPKRYMFHLCFDCVKDLRIEKLLKLIFEL
jgi:hypothetical protein